MQDKIERLKEILRQEGISTSKPSESGNRSFNAQC